MADQQKATSAKASSKSNNASDKKPNILFILSDDVGIWNLGAYNHGMMAGRTPNLDKLASEGAIFTDYYAETTCTAGRAAFITGELPIRTGLVTVGQAGATIGMPAAAPTIATVLKDMGYVTGQFGKNHLGDLNQFLPTVHGFDEFYGWLYHLDAMEDQFHPNYPKELQEEVGVRNVVHSWATDVDDPTVQPRWGKIGKQKIEDKGPLPPHPIPGIELNMETIDDVVLSLTENFIDKAVKDDKPFFVWMNTSRMHIATHLSPKYKALQNSQNGWTIQEAGMAQLDDTVGAILKKLDDSGLTDNTIVVFTADNGASDFSWPDGGTSPFKGSKGMGTEGGFRAPCFIRWPGKIKPNQWINGLIASLDWFPTFVAAAGDPNIVEELLKGKTLNSTNYKVHLDGYNQLPMLTEGKPSARNEFWYFTESELAAARIGDYKYTFITQPQGWFGPKVKTDWPGLTNLRLDPFEKMSVGESMLAATWYLFEIWRFVFIQKEVAKLAQTAMEFPPMQAGASFNLDSIKAQIKKAVDKRGSSGN